VILPGARVAEIRGYAYGEPGTPTAERNGMDDTVETRGDERNELAVGDSNNDGKPDVWIVDTDGDGKADLFQFDTDGDGKVDITIVDRTQDGSPDQVVDGDGGLPPTT
jgi:hypothetical protein